ncbi:expressed protein [Chlorella variabilis]|uniref:Expressed protein n=1 Tax=Chlorella variabilis TaxID=554065 RepID=E1ZRF8_CHLVA|nr:expressed protein [Chlorella variabilis]EFN51621.1 expressed protein [Chlorella variabilis]|eukprot:XP_005843723.1 expressed protein [Chlorella variabilis]
MALARGFSQQVVRSFAPACGFMTSAAIRFGVRERRRRPAGRSCGPVSHAPICCTSTAQPPLLSDLSVKELRSMAGLGSE